MRGKVAAVDVVGRIDGITPAYAGKSPDTWSGKQLGEDHPRVCGEKDDDLDDGILAVGSPPRMRGKVRPCSS